MEDYIQGVVCGYLTVQNGTRKDAKRKRMFVVLSDARMDYYVTDPRPAFEESIAESYTFTDKTQVHYYVTITPHAPVNSLCLTTDKTTDVYIADSAQEADVWHAQLTERLEALHQMVVGALVVRKELKVSQQVQRTLLQTKYTWRLKCVELGRSTLRYCGTQSGRKQKRAMNQFNLTSESYVSEEPVELLKSVLLAGFAVSSGEISALELKKIQRDVQNQRDLGRRGSSAGGPVYPFVVCTGPAHLHLAASTEQDREQWIVAIRLRIIALKHRHNRSKPKAGGNQAPATTTMVSSTRMHDFMEVQFVPGGPWKRRYVELENEMLKVKLNASTLGSKFETRLLPSCVLTPSLLKANAFEIQNLGQKVSLAPGTLQDSQKWMKAIKDVAYNVSPERCQKVFYDDITALLAHSVVYNVEVAGEATKNAGFVVEKHKKRITVLNHTPPTASADSSSKVRTTVHTVPQGSVLLGVSQVGMLHDSFETIWHKLRQKKHFNGSAMRLTFRAPMYKKGFLDATFKLSDRWECRRCVMRNGKLLLKPLPPPMDPSDEELQPPPEPAIELFLRDCSVELMNMDEASVRNVIKIKVDSSWAIHKVIYVRVHHDDDLFAWYTLLLLECGVAQDDPRYPLTLKTLKKLKQGTPLGLCEDQKRQTAKCKIAGRLLSEIEEEVRLQEPRLLERASAEQEQRRRDDLPPVPPDSPIRSLQPKPLISFGVSSTLEDHDAQALFQHLDAIGCGKISSSALSGAIDSLTRQLKPREREKLMKPVDSALKKLIPPSRPFVNITVEQAISVLKNISDRRIIELVRKFARHEVQCM